MEKQRPIRVHTGDHSLAHQLSSRLGSVLGRAVTVLCSLRDTLAPSILVTTTSQCSADECAGLAESGVSVVILAALPSSFQEQSYLSAGAAHYLPMNLDIEPLADALSALA